MYTVQSNCRHIYTPS